MYQCWDITEYPNITNYNFHPSPLTTVPLLLCSSSFRKAHISISNLTTLAVDPSPRPFRLPCVSHFVNEPHMHITGNSN